MRSDRAGEAGEGAGTNLQTSPGHAVVAIADGDAGGTGVTGGDSAGAGVCTGGAAGDAPVQPAARTRAMQTSVKRPYLRSMS